MNLINTLSQPNKPKMLTHLILGSILAFSSACALAEDVPFDTLGAFNPILPGYFADPTIKKFGETYYIYTTTDGNGGGRGPSQVWMSDDFLNWTLVPMNWPLSKTENYWAPDVVKGPDNRYYLYFTRPCEIFSGVSDFPIGPWNPVDGKTGLVAPNHLVKDVLTLDSHVFETSKGDTFMYWGTWGIFPNSGAGWGKLKPDMKTFDGLGKIPNTQIKDFFEAPFMLEKDGLFYFMYSSGSCHDSTYRVQYAVGETPNGDFKMGPNNPILATNADKTIDGPGHHSMLKEGDDYFMIYHRHDLPFTPNGLTRQICADRMAFGRPGEIKTIIPTHKGVGPLGKNTETSPNLAFGKKVTATSFYTDTLRNHQYKPEYAVDDNNGTVWRPGNNKMGHWLQVDLGSVQKIRRIHTQFEYATYYYQYRLETSSDGQIWQTFADRTENTRWGSPLVDRGDMDARYVRVTVTGTEMPGLFGSIWNLKVYGEDRVDRLEKIADKAFATHITPEQARSPSVSSKAISIPDPEPLVKLNAAELLLGSTLKSWTNQGSLGGTFDSQANPPTVGLAKGRKAIKFTTGDFLKASFNSPTALAGNSSFTVSTWVNNPQIGESECLLSWAGRGGPDATTAQFNYGTSPNFGAVGHWAFADMGFKDGAPEAGKWHHIAVVFDGVIERIYVNGKLNNSAAKMLLMHRGRPMFIGTSDPGTEFFDGYMASLEIYDIPLTAEQVANKAAASPVADVLQHLDSSRLDYGPLKEWNNEGSGGGSFISQSTPPVVEDVNGRIAARFSKGQSMQSTGSPLENANQFAWVATLRAAVAGKSTPLQMIGIDGELSPVTLILPDQAWHQVIITANGVILDRKLLDGSKLAFPATLKGVQLGSAEFDGAFSQFQLFRRPLSSEEIAQMNEGWKLEWKEPKTRFTSAPKALNSGIIAMSAEPLGAEFTGAQFLFAEISGMLGGKSSGWIDDPFFLADNLNPDTQYTYQLKVRDGNGNVFTVPDAASASTAAGQFQSTTSDFSGARDFLKQGVTNTSWSDLKKDTIGGVFEIITTENNTLRMQTKNTFWDGNPAYGPLLYRLVAGDFVAQVKVADYAGLADREPVGNCDGGLMIRLPEPKQGENLVSVSFFPPWNQGNMVTNVIDGGRSQKSNLLGLNAKPYLQIIRAGSQIHCRVSSDGKTWKELPESPMERPDLIGHALQVGLFHASNGDLSSYISFSDFKLTTTK